MKVYFYPEKKTRGNMRIYFALQKYLPGDFTECFDPNDADLTVFFATGRRNHLLQAVTDRQNQRYAVIQIALQSTRNPDPQDWMEIWQRAQVVWSYYQLPLTDYYHAPLAADPGVFYPEMLVKEYTILTTGDTVRDESLIEISNAVQLFGGREAHPRDVSDDGMRFLYSQSRYVSGLRRKDGFELPAVEGLFCGARPIMYDAPRYRQWFDGLAEFVPEEEPQKVTENLVKLFNSPYRPVTSADRKEAKRRFDWKKIAGGFWERCC